MVIMWISKAQAMQMLYGVPREITERNIKRKIADCRRLDFLKTIFCIGIILSKGLDKNTKIIFIFFLILLETSRTYVFG